MRSKRPPSAVSAPPTHDEGTRARLLAAAGELFAERGLRGATVRAIAERAGANVAAVNYHFGDKSRLYVEVMRSSFGEALARHPTDGGLPADAPVDERLRAFVRALLARARGVGRPAWQGRLMAREMADPSAAIDVMVREGIAPEFERLLAIVRELLGPRVPAEAVALAAASVVSQCLFWFFAEPVVARLPALKPFREAAATEAIARHVAEFSRAALARPKGRRR
ncbi:MAG: CerR family C-terminal domain-containing protein [Planctomycetes bacterium]|nr:CerR family C-terminal domain-containing protein [Planctomycetota bacterium]